MSTAAESIPERVVQISMIGSFCFGLVVGWVTYSLLRRTEKRGLGDLSTVIGAVAGAAVTALFPVKTGAFGVYCIGLTVGFFGYLLVAWIFPNTPVWAWMGQAPPLPQQGAANVNPADINQLPPNAALD